MVDLAIYHMGQIVLDRDVVLLNLELCRKVIQDTDEYENFTSAMEVLQAACIDQIEIERKREREGMH